MPKNEKKAFKPGDPLPGPDHPPQVGDIVNYIFHEHAGTKHQGKIYPATVKHVHEGHEGRLINVEVETGEKDPHRIGPTPYREYDADAVAGNTWHFAEAEETTDAPDKVEEKSKSKDKDKPKDK